MTITSWDICLKSYEMAIEAEKGKGIDAVKKAAEIIKEDLIKAYAVTKQEEEAWQQSAEKQKRFMGI